MTAWLMLLAAILSEVEASLSLKAAVENPVWYLPVVIGYSLAFVMLFQTLKTGMGLGVAYGIWAACGVALTAILATVIFGEVMTVMKSLGIVMVMGGVLLVEIGSQRAILRERQRALVVRAADGLNGPTGVDD
ncbi:MAG: DMT family transporter [Mycobacteriaceae bacterium]|uniref:DMT family transporter n=1 Tax=Corynebacterium sp. TaxID=1720 RepID=UPI003F98902C